MESKKLFNFRELPYAFGKKNLDHFMDIFSVLSPAYAGFLDSMGHNLDPYQRASLVGIPAIANGSYKVNKADLNKRIANKFLSKNDFSDLEKQVNRNSAKEVSRKALEYYESVKNSKFEPFKTFAHYSSISLSVSAISYFAGFLGGKILYNQ